MANLYRVSGPIDMRVWKGRRFENILKQWFEIMTLTSVDADLRTGRRLETGRRSESIIYRIKRWPHMIILDLPWVSNASFHNMSLILLVTFNSGENRSMWRNLEYLVTTGVYGKNRRIWRKPKYPVTTGVHGKNWNSKNCIIWLIVYCHLSKHSPIVLMWIKLNTSTINS